MTVRTPDALKLVRGTYRPDRAAPARPALPALDAVPAAPTWLTNIGALQEWRRLALVLGANGLLTEGNCGLLAHCCMLHAKLAENWNSGVTPTAALLTTYRALLSDLGLTSLPNVPAPPTKPNRFLKLGRGE